VKQRFKDWKHRGSVLSVSLCFKKISSYFSETASVGLRSGMIAMSDADIMLVAIKKISPYS